MSDAASTTAPADAAERKDERTLPAPLPELEAGPPVKPQDAPPAAEKPKRARKAGAKAKAATAASKKAAAATSGQRRPGRGRGRKAASTSTGRKATPRRKTATARKTSGAARGTRTPSEDQVLADKANALMTSSGPVSQTLSAAEVGYVRTALGGTKAKRDVVKLLGFKAEADLRNFVVGSIEQPDDKGKLRAFVAKVKAVHPSPRIRPRKVAAAAFTIAGAK